jgi:hypothetical protein
MEIMRSHRCSYIGESQLLPHHQIPASLSARAPGHIRILVVLPVVTEVVAGQERQPGGHAATAGVVHAAASRPATVPLPVV